METRVKRQAWSLISSDFFSNRNIELHKGLASSCKALVVEVLELLVFVCQVVATWIQLLKGHALVAGKGLSRKRIESGQGKRTALAHDDLWPEITAGSIHRLELPNDSFIDQVLPMNSGC